MMAGKDIIAQAPTGTGKTAAFGLPIVERLRENGDPRPQAIIVVPTRELAMQVAEALHAFGKYREMVTLPIYGGAPYERQLRALARGVEVVVGTPGRLLDHLRRETLKLDAIHTVILDEADEMLNMGFIEDIEAILAALPEERQMALFSATIPPRIADLAARFLHAPDRVAIAPKAAIAPRVRQVYYEAPYPAKPDALARILDLEEPNSVIVFVRTRNDADEVAERLTGLGYLAQAIHGEIPQNQRERVLDRFRNGRTQILVATDVAARGLDIPDVSHVINYDLPMDAESYVHRIGRTGRAGKGGAAITLVTPRETRQLRYIEKAIHHRLQRLRLPTPFDVAARRRATFREDVLKILDAGQLDPFLALVEDMTGSREPAELAAAAFKMAAQAREAARPGSGVNWVEMPATLPEPEPPPEAEEVAPRSRARREFAADGTRPGADGGKPEGGRRPRTVRRSDQPPPEGAYEMARLFMQVGRQHGVRPADIVGAIANEAGVPGDQIGDIDIYDTFSFVEVPRHFAANVRGALSHAYIRGQRPRVRLALPDDRWGSVSDDDGRDLGMSGVHDTNRGTFPGRGPRRPEKGGASGVRALPTERRAVGKRPSADRAKPGKRER
jgi:ATP-dependent RNA helicase DeaD